jgi:hypothetical protein
VTLSAAENAGLDELAKRTDARSGEVIFGKVAAFAPLASPPHSRLEGRVVMSGLMAEHAAEESKAESPHLRKLRRILDPNISFERAWRELNDPQHRPTPSTTIEAIMLSVRERGVIALKDPCNIARLSRCDTAAKAQINRRISALKKSGLIQ